MATQEKTWNVANRLHSLKDSDNPEVNHIIAGADEIYDDTKGAKQSDINTQNDAALSDRYTKAETYSKEQLDALITTPDVEYVNVVATNATTSVTDVLPATGEANTIYRVGNWNGTQYDPIMYALLAWDGTTYVCLAVRSFVGEVYDISVNHPDGQGNPTPYADLTAALGTDGANIPADIRRGGMSVKFVQGTVQSIDNKYVQFRYMSSSTAVDDFTNVANWQGVDDEPTAGSDNLVKSRGVFEMGRRMQGVNSFQFDFTTGSTDQYDNRQVAYNFVAGHKYKISVITNSSTITYFSLRNDSGNTVDGQKNLIKGSGVRTGIISCSADATWLYMSLQEAMSEGVVFEVTLVDMSEASVVSNYENIKELDTRTTNINNKALENENDINIINCQLENQDLSIQKPFTFSNTGHFVKSDGTVGNSVNWKQSNIVAVSKGQLITFKAVGTSSKYNVLVSLTDANGTSFTPVVIKDGTDLETAEKVFYSVKQDGYVILQYWKIDGDAVLTTDSERLQRIESMSDTLDGVYADCSLNQEILQIESHDEQRDLSTTVKGYRINADGTHNESSNWKTSNPIQLFANEKIVVECASTSTGYYIIFLTDAEETFYTPLVKAVSADKSVYEYIATSDCYVIVQGRNTNSVPIVISIHSDSSRIVKIENDVQYLMNSLENIPNYVIEERERVYRKLSSLSNSDVAIIAFNTDQHFTYPYSPTDPNASDPSRAMRGIKSIVDVAKSVGLDLIVFGGDVAGYKSESDGDVFADIDSTVDGILGEVNYLNHPFIELNVPCISLPGNHDAFQNNGNITAQGMYNAHFRRSKWTDILLHEGTDNCDSVLDDTDKKIRYIFVDVDSRNVRSESYSTFLTDALSTMGNGYKAIIFSHHPLTNEFSGQIFKYSSDEDTNPKDAFSGPIDLHSIINAHASDIIACICGHVHTDAWGINSNGVLFITTTSAVHTRARFEYIPWKASHDNAKETAFDFFVIDKTAQTIEAVRYGQGTNRKWKYAGDGAGLIGYKNCVNGIVSVASVSLVFTNTEDNSDVVTVTADGNGFYEVYLTLNATYNITCSGYTLDVESVEVDGNKELNINAELIEE